MKRIDNKKVAGGERNHVFSDRAKGIPSFHEVCKKSLSLNCSFHILANMKNKCRGCANADVEKAFWKLQQSGSEEDFEINLGQLSSLSPTGGEYLKKIQRDIWAQYAYTAKHGVSSHGHKTSNIAECMNAKFKGLKSLNPFECTVQLIKDISDDMRRHGDRIANLDVPPGTLTKYFEEIFGHERDMVRQYKSTRVDSNTKGYVESLLTGKKKEFSHFSIMGCILCVVCAMRVNGTNNKKYQRRGEETRDQLRWQVAVLLSQTPCLQYTLSAHIKILPRFGSRHCKT